MDESLRNESLFQRMKIRQSRDISEESFENIFRANWASIYRLLLRMVVDPAEAEDLALETFFRLYKNQSALKEESNTRGWLHKVAANLGLQSIRNFKRRERYEIDAGKNALDEAPENQPHQIFAAKEDHRFARLALGQMNGRQAELLIMRHSGMAYKEIADALRLSPTSIGPLLLRAEREFEKHFRALAQ